MKKLLLLISFFVFANVFAQTTVIFPNSIVTNSVTATGTGTTIATYSAKIQNSTGTNNGLMLHDNGFFGVHTDSSSEVVYDVNGANRTVSYFKTNCNFDTAGLVTFHWGNKNTSGRAASRFLLGNGIRAAQVSIDCFPNTYTVGDIAPATALFGGGSNFDHLMIYNDGGGVGSPNTYGNIEMGTINTLPTGLTGLVISGKAATQNFVGVGTLSPTWDFHVLKSTFNLTAKVENTGNTTTSITHITAQNSGADFIRMTMPSALYTTNGGFIGRYGNIYTSGLGLNLISDNTGGINFYTGGFASGNNYIQFSSAGLATFGSGISIPSGKTITISSGTNKRAGNAPLVGGTVTVSNTTVTANTLVVLTRKTSGGTIGTSITYTLSAGVSFTITSDNILDTSTFTYMLIENP